MIAKPPIQAELTKQRAQVAYNAAMESIRGARGRSRAEAVEIVVVGLQEWEAVAILRYLLAEKTLPEMDVLLAKALATRLGVTIVVQRKELWG